jgi:pheromone a factor receptor
LDIAARFIIGYAVAIPCASLCVNRRILSVITTRTNGREDREDQLKRFAVDSLICVGIPFFQMAIQYIPQGHRFDIFQEVGCFPFTYNTPVAFVLVYSWPVILGLISAFYAGEFSWCIFFVEYN